MFTDISKFNGFRQELAINALSHISLTALPFACMEVKDPLILRRSSEIRCGDSSPDVARGQAVAGFVGFTPFGSPIFVFSLGRSPVLT